MSGIKNDQGKAPLDLLDPVAIEGLGKILQHGASVYGEHNWRGGIKWTRLISALLRHTFALMRGEDIDPESGLPHSDHILCNAMFLSNHYHTRKDLDNRYKS